MKPDEEIPEPCQSCQHRIPGAKRCNAMEQELAQWPSERLKVAQLPQLLERPEGCPLTKMLDAFFEVGPEK